MLEMLGVPYTGPTPRGLILSQDVAATRTMLQQVWVPTPAFRVTSGPDDGSWEGLSDLRYPVLVRPRHDPIRRERIVDDPSGLESAVKDVVRRYRQEAVVEEYIAGRDIHVALLGNEPVHCLPLVEAFADRTRTCPAPIEDGPARRIRDCARGAYRACGGRDYARVDVRVDASGDPYVLAVRSIGILARTGSFVRAATEAGYSFGDLLCHIVEIARMRYVSGGSDIVHTHPSVATAVPLHGKNDVK